MKCDSRYPGAVWYNQSPVSYTHLDVYKRQEGDSFCVRVYDDSGKNVTVKESSDPLKVRSTKKLSKNRKVCISYPEDVKLQELEIEICLLYTSRCV